MKYSHKNLGFTLIELIVSIIILTVVGTVLLGNRSQYAERLSLNDQTYKLALYLRQAQIYSLGAKGFSSGGQVKFDIPYGIYFHRDELNQFRFFADEDKDGKYDDGEYNEIIPVTGSIKIDKVCGIDDGEEICFYQGSGSSFRRLVVTFKRPDSAALIRFLNPSSGGGNDVNNIDPPAIIYLKSNAGLLSSITIDSTGGISIDNSAVQGGGEDDD